MEIVRDKISLETLKEMSKKMFGRLVKAVVDIEKEIMAVDAEMHADEEEALLDNGSQQQNLWGINLHPDLFDQENWIEFDSLINIRPSDGNRSRSVDDINKQKIIRKIVKKLVIP